MAYACRINILFIYLCMVTLSSFSSTTNARSPYFDVMNYGDVGNGKTDDS